MLAHGFARFGCASCGHDHLVPLSCKTRGLGLCLLVLELPHRLYENVESIFVYPSTVVRPERPQGVFVRARELLASGPIMLLGEAHTAARARAR